MKNILLIVVDTLRPDHLGCYGYHRPTSPCLDDLAGRSTVLDSLWSASNFTAPAFTSLFTGLYPHQHGVFDFTAKAPSSPVHDVLRMNDVRMGGVVTFRFFKNLLSRIWGEIEAVTDTRSFDYSKDLPQAVTESSLDWMQNHAGGAPFCLFVHYDGPHLPFRLPEEFANAFDSTAQPDIAPDFLSLFFPQEFENLAGKSDQVEASMFQLIENVNWGKRKVSPEAKQWLIDKYDASILYNDRAIGDLLKGMVRLGLAEDTLVCILSDHGEEFLEHGHLSHGGIHLNEEIIRTVGIIHDPSAPTGQTLSHPLGQVDIFPTLLALAGARDIPETMVRRSIAGRVNPAAGPTADPAPVFCHGKSKVAARMGSHKYIHTRPSAALGTMARLRLWLKMALLRELGEEIYDLQNDPAELENLISRKDLKSMLRGALDTHLQDQSGILIAGSADDEERRRIEQEMKDLGYM